MTYLLLQRIVGENRQMQYDIQAVWDTACDILCIRTHYISSRHTRQDGSMERRVSPVCGGHLCSLSLSGRLVIVSVDHALQVGSFELLKHHVV